jgi:DNA repair exonuclease SbcCD ATPase subunit
MRLLTVEISNFMPFGEDLCWDVPQVDSLLLLVKGVYADSTKSNGTGKSSLFEAIYWALTGEIVRRVKAVQVIRTGKHRCRVAVTFKNKKATYKVTRTRTRDQLILVECLNLDTGEVFVGHTAAETTALIMEELNLTPELLAMTCFFGRKFLTFSRMEPRDRANLVAKIAKSDLWEQARSLAHTKVTELNNKISFNESLAIQHQESIDDLYVKIGEAEHELQGKEFELAEKRSEYHSEFEVLDIACATCKRVSKEIELELIQQNNDRDNLKTLYSEADKALSEMHGTTTGLTTQINDLTMGIAGDVCPTCGQTIKRSKAIKQTVTRLTKELADLKEQKNALSSDKTLLYQGLKDLSTKISQQDVLLIKHTKSLVAYDQEILEIGHAIEALDLDTVKTGLVSRLTYLKDDQLSKYTSILEEVHATIDELKQKHQITTFWVTGFKELRLQSMKTAVVRLAEYINAYALRLGLVADQVYMDVTTPRSGKGFKPEITLGLVRGNNRLAFNQLSSGEIQCLDLACFLASGSWLRQVYDLDLDFRVWDEPLDSLDTDSKYKTFQLIKDIEDTPQRFVIDHDAHFQDLFNHVVTIVKEDDVSYIKESG